MKKTLLISMCFALSLTYAFSQTTATDFIADDCSGTEHNLFSKLNNGKVVVIAWVMPCFSCKIYALRALGAVKSYSESNLGRVEFWLSDDYANTNCGSMNSWADDYGFTGNPVFSSKKVDMGDYGKAGMPKVVVLGGGTKHTVCYNKNDGNITEKAVRSAIKECMVKMVGIADSKQNVSIKQVEAFPNPAQSQVSVSFNLNKSENVDIIIFNSLKQIVNKVSLGEKISGSHQVEVDLNDMSSGLYFLQVKAGVYTQNVKLTVAN
jgi:hypothetical protein